METITKTLLGSTRDGAEVDIYTLQGADGMRARITTYGALLTELHVPDAAGTLADVVLGFPDLDGYLGDHPYFGATVGRVANRIANARFTLNGTEHRLAQNDGHHHLHGGQRGLDTHIWSAQPMDTPDGPALALRTRSPDGEEGYPGNLDITVIYTLTRARALRIDYTATTDAPTPVNLTHHSYFNLAGTGDILGHVLELRAARCTPVDATLIPTGVIAAVAGTPFDFRAPVSSGVPIGARITELGGNPPGYDINYVLDNQNSSLALAARVREPVSGRIMDVYTTEPGIQLYTGHMLDGSLVGKGGRIYDRYAGLCLEAQHYPDAINQPGFPSIVLRPDNTYTQTTMYAFAAE